MRALCASLLCREVIVGPACNIRSGALCGFLDSQGLPLGARLGCSLGHCRVDGSMLGDLIHGSRDATVFPFTEMCLAKVTTHQDDPTGTWYFELEVGVVGDGHELGIARPTQDGVVSA